jgi:hypothetical protein
VTSLFSKENHLRLDSVLVTLFAVALLARSIAINLFEGTGLSMSKRRIQSVDSEFATRVMVAAAAFLFLGGTEEDLIQAVLNVDAPAPLPPGLDLMQTDKDWQRYISALQKIRDQRYPTE